MIGLIVQLTADYCEIWSTAILRFIKYSRNYLPYGSHEGDWVEFEFDSSRVLKGIKKVEDMLETKREKGIILVLDIFIVNYRRKEAFCENFGFVRIENRKGGGEWIEERKAKDHCIHLWITIVPAIAQFSIEDQSLDIANSKDGKYAEKYTELLELRGRMNDRSPRNEISDERREFDEMIVIVGFDEKCGRFFSSSRSGEAVIPRNYVWKGEGEVKLGDVFLATLSPTSDPGVEFRVVHLKKRMALWKGVELYMNGKGLRARLTGKVVERRQTCFVLNTTPFGLITCPLDAKYLRPDTQIRDNLRVRVVRVTPWMMKDDHPSKWHVMEILEEPAEEYEKDGSNRNRDTERRMDENREGRREMEERGRSHANSESDSKPVDEWYTGIVTEVTEDTVSVASPKLKEDGVLYLKVNLDEAMGKWIKFQLQRLSSDPPERMRINPITFTQIDNVFETRNIGGIPEIRVTLSYRGEEDGGRPMLRSEMGAVRDCDGLFTNDRDVHGLYYVWIVRYKKNNHISRWRFSRKDAKVERSMESREIRMASLSRSPTSLKHQSIEEDRMREERLRRMEGVGKEEESRYEEGELKLRGIMKGVILDDKIRDALFTADRKAYNEMFEILFSE